MIEIPILRHGRPYESVETATLAHHATREPVARLSIANSGLIARDISRMDANALARIAMRDLFAMCRRAAELFATATLPCGDRQQSFDDYIQSLSATTGMPVTYCRNNAAKIERVLQEIETVIAGLTRGVPPEVLDRGYGVAGGRTLSFHRVGRTFGAVLPSNSPGVHTLWIPAVALKTPIVLKPGREEPWTPLRVIAALTAAGVPREAFGFYPTDHQGATTLLERVDRAMLFGDASTTRAWADDARIELHGPGYSKVLIGDDWVDQWPRHIDLMVESIAANGGRSCINASGVWAPRHGREIAQALAERLATVQALPADDPNASIAAFASPSVAERISEMIDRELREPGATDLTQRVRGSSRLVRRGEIAYLLPTIIWCERPDHPLAQREYLMPYAAVTECPIEEMPDRIGPTLIAAALTADRSFARRLLATGDIDRLNIGAIPTIRLSWDQPHEGNLFDLLYRRRALQVESPDVLETPA
ncbi:MAG: aldehyde dehydrogenase family protein [Planctomycetota bacterium]|nr:MAG: aldehyde dehydrogenase family protein [Planctomycetota bacterium]